MKANANYFNEAFECIFEIGVKLAHVLWRKVIPEDRESADESLNMICYDLLSEGKYALACTLLDFAVCTIKKHTDDQTRRIFVVNQAQAYKWAGDSEKAIHIIDQEDWSASSDMFCLAEAAIRSDVNLACKIVKRIGSNGMPRKVDYRDWPLFQELRSQPEFVEIFQEVFDEPLNVLIEKKIAEDEPNQSTLSSADNEEPLTLSKTS